MKFHVLTLFPNMIMQGLNTSIIGRAVEKKLIEINAVNIRDYTLDKHGKVDDYPYGGGAGMLMQAQPVYDAHQAVTEGRKVRTVYVTPQGVPFTQKLAENFVQEDELVFLCGHYEGIDERVLEEVVTDYVSIGDYVLTGGELPAMVMIDAISRLVPEVLNNDVSAETESFHNDLLEYPQYSRPEEWHGKKVPEVLLSGNHNLIKKWRLEQSEKRTERVRPDLYAKYQEKQRVIKRLSKKKRNNIHIMEGLARGTAELLFAEGNNVLVYNPTARVAMMTVENREVGERVLELVPEEVNAFVTSQEFMNDLICNKYGFVVNHECYQACYTRKEAMPVAHKDIRPLTMEQLDYLTEHYTLCDREYLIGRIQAGVMFGAWVDDKLVAFVGCHDEGSMGMMYVEEGYRGRGIGESLTAFSVNHYRQLGFTPYDHIVVGNDASVNLQTKLGASISKDTIWWLGRES